MLGLFFALVLVCAFFFAIGFSFGKKTLTIPSPGVAAAAAASSTSVARPSAARNTQPVTPATDLSFYKSVEQKTADTTLTPAPAKPAEATPAAEAVKTDTSASAAPPTPVAGSYYVQVAAVTRQEDADALVEALKKKQYPAFAVGNSNADKFVRVQVGPFTELKDAEAMRARLIADGYNPIVKK